MTSFVCVCVCIIFKEHMISLRMLSDPCNYKINKSIKLSQF